MFLVATAFQSSTDELFRFSVNEIVNTLDSDPEAMHYQEALEKLTSKYNSLCTNGLYSAGKDRKSDKDNALVAMTATVKNLEATIKGMGQNNNSNKKGLGKKAKVKNQSSPTKGKNNTEKPKYKPDDKASYINNLGNKVF